MPNTDSLPAGTANACEVEAFYSSVGMNTQKIGWKWNLNKSSSGNSSGNAKGRHQEGQHPAH